MISKSEIREIICEKRSDLDEVWIEDMSGVILDRLVGMSEYDDAGLVACYLNVGAEVSTAGIVQQCLIDGKRVCVPAFDSETKEYRMAVIDPDTKMVSGSMNIEEPADPVWVDADDIDLFLVPGLAFDVHGGRVGYGGGCYDGIMKDRSGLKVALAFEFQLFDEVPVEEHDVFVNVIITETKILAVN